MDGFHVFPGELPVVELQEEGPGGDALGAPEFGGVWVTGSYQGKGL